MIDTSKMKALAAFADRLRVEDALCKHGGFSEEADLIYALLSELEAREADRRDAALWRKWWKWAYYLNKKPFELARDCDRYVADIQREGEEK
jgi:hypothetical protein